MEWRLFFEIFWGEREEICIGWGTRKKKGWLLPCSAFLRNYSAFSCELLLDYLPSFCEGNRSHLSSMNCCLSGNLIGGFDVVMAIKLIESCVLFLRFL